MCPYEMVRDSNEPTEDWGFRTTIETLREKCTILYDLENVV